MLPPRPKWGGAFAAVAILTSGDEVGLYGHAAVQPGYDVIEGVGGLAAVGAAVLPSLEDASSKALLIESLRDK